MSYKMFKITCSCGYVALVTPFGLSEAMTDLIKVGYIIASLEEYTD